VYNQKIFHKIKTVKIFFEIVLFGKIQSLFFENKNLEIVKFKLFKIFKNYKTQH